MYGIVAKWIPSKPTSHGVAGSDLALPLCDYYKDIPVSYDIPLSKNSDICFCVAPGDTCV